MKPSDDSTLRKSPNRYGELNLLHRKALRVTLAISTEVGSGSGDGTLKVL